MNTAPMLVDYVLGDATGLQIPAHSEALRAAGAPFLTRAFQAFGALPHDISVAEIVRFERCPGGSTGDKLFLSVRYGRGEAGLHTELFVKFSRDFTDSMRDHGRFEMEPEARFAAISRLPGFPISTPAAYFADYHHESGTGLVITQRIAFGEDGIEPHRRKCLDYELADPLPYYRALVTAIARLAAAHKSGRLAPDIDERFPCDLAAASSDPITYSEDQLRAVVSRYAAFAERCPQLLPANVRAPDFIALMEQEALRILALQDPIQRYLRGNRDLVALCHWNAHIDNAWFWRDPAGALQCGLIDWGRVNQITAGSALWGCLSAAHHDVWAHHFDELLALYAAELHAHGGAAISHDELELHVLLHIASMGVARVLAFPKVILARLPQAEAASGPRDPMFLTSDPARNCLHILTVFVSLWRKRGFGASLDKLLARAKT